MKKQPEARGAILPRLDRRRHANEQWRRLRDQKSRQPVNRTAAEGLLGAFEQKNDLTQELWEERKPFERTKAKKN